MPVIKLFGSRKYSVTEHWFLRSEMKWLNLREALEVRHLLKEGVSRWMVGDKWRCDCC